MTGEVADRSGQTGGTSGGKWYENKSRYIHTYIHSFVPPIPFLASLLKKYGTRP